MERQITWSPRAVWDFENVLIYLETDWSLRIAKAFFTETFHCISSICNYPEIGIQSHAIPASRKILITKHNILIYLVDGDKIIVLNIIDTRSSTYTI